MTDTNLVPVNADGTVSVMPPPIAEKSAPTIESLTVEIKFYLGQMGQNAIEVGKRLIQAKELVPHGQWKEWLSSNFNLKYRMAANFMAIADRWGNRTNSQEVQSIALLGATQMIAMLALPEGEEEKFLTEQAEKGTSVQDMTVKNLREEIKTYKSQLELAKKEAEDAKYKAERWRATLDTTEAQMQNLDDEYREYQRTQQTLLRNALNRENGLLDENRDQQVQIAQLEDKVAKLSKKKTVEVPPSDYEDLKREVEELRNRPIEVAVEYPDDYDTLKRENAELKERENKVPITYEGVRKLEQLFNAANSLLNFTNLTDSVKNLVEKDPSKFQQSLTALRNLCTELENHAAVATDGLKKATTNQEKIEESEKPLSRAEIIKEIGNILAYHNPNKEKSVKAQQIVNEMGYEKIIDMTDEDLNKLWSIMKGWRQ